MKDCYFIQVGHKKIFHKVNISESYEESVRTSHGDTWAREYQISDKGPGRKKTYKLCWENSKECGLSRKNNRRIIGDEVRSDEPGANSWRI